MVDEEIFMDEEAPRLSSKDESRTANKGKSMLKTVLVASVVLGLAMLVGTVVFNKKDNKNDTVAKDLVWFDEDDAMGMFPPEENEEEDEALLISMELQDKEPCIDDEAVLKDEEAMAAAEEIVPDWEEENSQAEEDPVLSLDDFYGQPELLDAEPEDMSPLVYERKLQMDHGDKGDDHHGMHMSLACNENLTTAVCSGNSFASLLSNTASNETVEVPCGECYQVDITDGQEVLRETGLRIIGKLYFPSNANLTIRTKFVFVEGLLKMDTPAVGNQVKFSMYGEEHQTFISKGAMGACSAMSGGCDMGSKVIAVHGGQVDIRGIEETCPSWEKLTAVGAGEPVPFVLPCNSWNTGNYGTDCWTSDVIELTGSCVDEGTRMRCPIKNTAAFIGSGENRGVKFTSIANEEFQLPSDGTNTLNPVLSGKCGRASHTDRYNACVIYCPFGSNNLANIGAGINAPMTFTSVATPTPEYNGVPAGVEHHVAGCSNAVGHTNAWNRCAIVCKLYKTVAHSPGTNWENLQLTSRHISAEEAGPFPYPTNSSQASPTFTLGGKCSISAGHTRGWKRCIVHCPLEQTVAITNPRFEMPVQFNNPRTNNTFQTSGILHWSHGGRSMYLFAQQYTELDDDGTTVCNPQVEIDINAAFSPKDSIDLSYPVAPIAAAGADFSIDKVMHWAHAGSYLYILPTAKDPAMCDATAEDFSLKFPVGSGINVSYPSGPSCGQTFNVNKVHHWAHASNYMFFLPEKDSVTDCAQTASEFSAMFPSRYGIDVSYRNQPALGQAMTSSHIIHWSWHSSYLYFKPDQTIEDINNKFQAGYQLQVSLVTPETETYEIQVSPQAADCWKPGSELLVTSHTRDQNDQQVRVIESADSTTGVIRLTDPVVRPLTLADHPDFAVEVASLNRNIVFEADDDDNDEFIGGHFVVHHTSSAQHVEGVEIRNFGQQGRLGKYPLHFHMCGDSPGSLVKKNVVRQSNQRCYVAHLTNNVTFEDNVAYDSFGHCYFIEDGAEMHNTFTRNLGSGVKIMPTERVSLLEAASGRDETDDKPHGFNGASVFWISNPMNHFYGNVAAGGDMNGYWFETRGSRMHMPLGTFKDNEVHSCGAMAFSTYSPGWRPNEVALIDNLKVYRNRADGAFLHVTKNLHFQGGLFADNGSKDVFITRGDNLVFDGTAFMGQTAFASKNCGSTKHGIHLDPFRLHETVLGHSNGEYRGTIVKNATFENYSLDTTGCHVASAPMRFGDHQTFLEAYNAPHTIEDVFFDSPAMLDACMPGSNIDDVAVEIVSDVHHAFTGSQGFLVSPKFLPIIPTTCEDYNECLKFCPGACLRTVSVVAGDTSFAEDIVMVVSDASGNSISINRDVRGFPVPIAESNKFSDAYTVVLPKGDFTVQFMSISSPSTQVWPGFAYPVFEAAPSCSNHIAESDLTFSKPAAGRSTQCDELIHNGDFDTFSVNGWGIEGWNGFNFDVKHMATSGIGGTGALATTRSTTSGNWPNQVIDASCLQAGQTYEVQISYKIVNGAYDEIHQNVFDNSPHARVYSGIRNNITKVTQSGWTTVGRTSEGSSVTGWRTISGTWVISENMGKADIVKFHILGGPDQLLIDNVSVVAVGESRRNLRTV